MPNSPDDPNINKLAEDSYQSDELFELDTTNQVQKGLDNAEIQAQNGLVNGGVSGDVYAQIQQQQDKPIDQLHAERLQQVGIDRGIDDPLVLNTESNESEINEIEQAELRARGNQFRAEQLGDAVGIGGTDPLAPGIPLSNIELNERRDSTENEEPQATATTTDAETEIQAEAGLGRFSPEGLGEGFNRPPRPERIIPDEDGFPEAEDEGSQSLSESPTPAPEPEPEPETITEITGTPRNDRLYGTDGRDNISALQKNDRVYAGDGDDLVHGNEGNDKLYGQDGNDELHGDQGNDRLYGGNGNDQLYGGEGNDRLDGGQGDDVITGGAGNDNIRGGDGDDTFLISGNNDGFDNIHGGSGYDKIVGSDGDDTIGLRGLSSRSGIEEIDGGAGSNIVSGDHRNNSFDFKNTTVNNIDAVYGGDGKDKIRGNDSNETFHGEEGNDRLDGRGGDDNLFGGTGNDRIHGGDGNDNIYGGSGVDKLYGGNGNDIIYGDELTNELGENLVLNFSFEDAVDTFNMQRRGWDVYDEANDNPDDLPHWQSDSHGIEIQRDGRIFNSSHGHNHVELDAHRNSSMHQDIQTQADQTYLLSFDFSARPNVPADSNIIEVYFGGEMIAEVTAEGRGNNTAQWQTYSFEVDADLDVSRLEFRAAGTNDSLGGLIDNISLQQVSDNLISDASVGANDVIYAGNGDDTVYGGGGDDIIRGDNGNDTLYGEDGNDTLRGGRGNDIIDGGQGFDTVQVRANSRHFDISANENGDVIVEDLRNNAREGTDVLTNVESIEFANEELFLMQGDVAGQVTGSIGWTDVIGLVDDGELQLTENNDGSWTMMVDGSATEYVLTLSEGAVVSHDHDSIALTDDASGVLTNTTDNVSISFNSVEEIQIIDIQTPDS